MQATRLGALILSLITTLFFVTTTPSLAQTIPRLEQLHVDLWPEYDRPDMLVIYRGTLSADTPLPATLTFRLPARVGEPHAVAYNDGSGNLFTANYSTSITQDQLVITLEAPTRDFQLEFYDRLNRVSERRSYTFLWPGDYAVDQLSLMLLPPSGATEVKTEPALSSARQDTGTTSYGDVLGSLAAGQEARLVVSYVGGPSDSGGKTSAPASKGGNSTPLIVGAAGVVLLLAILGGMWYTRRPVPQVAQTPSPQRRPKRSRRERRREQSKHTPAREGAKQDKTFGLNRGTKPSSAAYCTHCGHPLHQDDRFCGNCGTAVREN